MVDGKLTTEIFPLAVNITNPDKESGFESAIKGETIVVLYGDDVNRWITERIGKIVNPSFYLSAGPSSYVIFERDIEAGQERDRSRDSSQFGRFSEYIIWLSQRENMRSAILSDSKPDLFKTRDWVSGFQESIGLIAYAIQDLNP